MLRIARKKAFEMECGFHWLSSHRPNTIIKIGIRIGPKSLTPYFYLQIRSY